MRTFFAVLKNNYLRLLPRIVPVAVFIVFTMATMVFAVYITGVQQVKAHVAYIEQSTSEKIPQSSKSLNITVLREKPPRSSLVTQKYDATVTADGNGGTKLRRFAAALIKTC